MSTEDMHVDRDGHAYLRTTEVMGRFDLRSWREVPFDYGIERKTQFAYDAKGHGVLGALHLPSQSPVWWHQQGFDINGKGDIAVFCANTKGEFRPRDNRQAVYAEGRDYKPNLYPGRYTYGELHIFDKHGKLKIEDAIPGIPDGHGTYMDNNGGVYLLVRGRRVYGDNKDVGFFGGTIVKFDLKKKGRFISGGQAPIPLPAEDRPKRLPDIRCGYMGDVWIEGAEWMYGGVGFCRPGPCQCWNCRFVVDKLGRSFAPENLRNQFAVLDTNGNLILRIGRTGNVDDGKPSAPVALEPPKQVSIGGDEVALMYANYAATHTDRRLFIADTGNLRILSVKLGYHAEEKVALKDVPDQGTKRGLE